MERDIVNGLFCKAVKTRFFQRGDFVGRAFDVRLMAKC
jgi:hypothetical protein